MKNISFKSPLDWSKSYWFFDVDDTLIDTEGITAKATLGMQKSLEQHIARSKAEALRVLFTEMFELMMRGYRVSKKEDWGQVLGGEEAFEQLFNNLYSHQKQVVEEFGSIKKWSRELFIKLSADQLGLVLSPAWVQEAAAAYWEVVEQHVKIFKDSKELILEIRRLKRPIFLLTSSDARLKMRRNSQFIYQPHHSELLKRARIVSLKNRGLDFDTLTIGDPEDKPGIEFFQKGVKQAEEFVGSKINLKNAIFNGDSFAGDLQTPKEVLGFGLVVLRDPQIKKPEFVDAHQLNLPNLSYLAEVLK